MINLAHNDKSINFPELPNVWKTSNFYIIWRMWIVTDSSLMNRNSSIKFTIKTEVSLIIKSNFLCNDWF